MIETMMGLMLIALMMAGFIIGGFCLLLKASGESPTEFVQGFVKGFKQGFAAPEATTASPIRQNVEVQTFAPASKTVPPGKIPAIVMLFLALLYLVSPIDFIPDLIPGLCHLDDIGVMTLAVRNAFKAFA